MSCVLVLSFDHLPPAAALSGDEESQQHSPPRSSAFRMLDQQAAFFAQHLSQDIRTDRPPFCCFGSEPDFRRFRHSLQQFETEFCLLQVDAAGNCEICNEPLTLPELPTAGRPQKFSGTTPESILPGSPQGKGICWIHVWNSLSGSEGLSDSTENGTGSADNTFLNEILDQILRWRDRLWEISQQPVPLLVTALRGSGRTVSEPFESAFPADLARVPLWVNDGRNEYCRLTSVSGSRDVLPTILELAKSVEPESPHHETPKDEPSEYSAGSLVPLCSAPGRYAPRSLLIRADFGEAVRTQDFLCVRRVFAAEGDVSTSLPGASDGISAAGDASRFFLYAQPEDPWNVHDQSTVYEGIVQDLVAKWP